MSNFSSTYPAIRPTYQIDFSNGKRIPPNATFSRSDSPIDATKAAASAVHFWSNEKHISSENLIINSDASDWYFDSSNFTTTASQTGPDGGSNATQFTEKANGSQQYKIQSGNFTPIANQEITYSVWLKQTSGSRDYQQIRVGNIGGGRAWATFNLTNGTVDQVNGNLGVTASVNAGPTGWYQCVMRFTPDSTTALSFYIYAAAASGGELPSVTGDTGNSYSLFGAQVSTIGQTTTIETSGQIHREYAPTLKSVATAGAARFEYDPTDGQSVARGILIEGQSTNAVGYSDSLASWNQSRLTATNASAVGPTGSLNAALLTPSTDAGFEHIIYASSVTTSVTGTVTLSGYFKAAGYDYVTLGIGNTATGNFSHALFNLSTGAYVTNNSGGSNSYVSSSTESVGNNWWRLVATFSTSRSNEQFVIGPASTSSPTYDSNWGTPTYTGDGYSSVLATGIQAEIGKSFASSLITSNSGSETTRAAESLSVATADIGYTGGPVTGIVDAVNIGTANYPTFATITDSTGNQRVMVQGNASNVDTYVLTDGTQVANPSSALNTTASKVGFRSDTNNFATVVNGGTVATDTSGPIPASASTLHIGQNHNSQYQVNGNIKRIALYNEALSDTNLQALTS